MFSDTKNQLKEIIRTSIEDLYPKESPCPSVELEIPADSLHGDLSCNIALKSAKHLRKSPQMIANQFMDRIQNNINASSLKDKIEKMEVKNPGFINIFFSSKALSGNLEDVFNQGQNYGRSSFGKDEKIQIEFVSANPTGPLSVAHARQAAVGDVLGNILLFLGFDITKEYYVNDEGNQINILGKSIQLRTLEILGEEVDFPEECYQGEYIKEMAKVFIEKHQIETAGQGQETDLNIYMEFGVDYLMDVILNDLSDFGIRFDVWAHQSEIATEKRIEKICEFLKKSELAYESEGALWFKSTAFGDDKDRVLRKSDGAYTYLAPDIVYHKDKFDRKFNRVVNIWGPDHHGYINRIKAAAQALGKEDDSLTVLIVQLATIYRKGKPVSMSTRRGQYISLREVIDEVGVDAARFFFLMRHISIHLDFDLELAKKETPENPVYYIQYANARINSINRKATEENLKEKRKGFLLLKEQEELDLIKKISNFPECLMNCYVQLDPYTLVSYLQELATIFHKFYDSHRVLDQDKEISAQRLGLINATKIVLANGLSLLGVSIPEKM